MALPRAEFVLPLCHVLNFVTIEGSFQESGDTQACLQEFLDLFISRSFFENQSIFNLMIPQNFRKQTESYPITTTSSVNENEKIQSLF